MGGRKRAGFRGVALLVSTMALPVELRADDGSTGAIDAALLTCAVTAHCADLAMSPDEALEFLEMSSEQAKGVYEKKIGAYQQEPDADEPDGGASEQSSGQQEEQSETGSVDQALLTCAVEADCSDLAMSPDEALEFLEMSPEQAKEAHERQNGLFFDEAEADAPVEPSASDEAAVNDSPTQEETTLDESEPDGGAAEEDVDAANETSTEEPLNFDESDLQASDDVATDDTPTNPPLDFDQTEGTEVGTNRTTEDSLLRCASGFGCDEVSDYIKPEDAAIFLDDEQRKIMCAAGQGCVDNFEHYTPEQMRKELGLTQDEALKEFAKRVGEKPEYIDPSNGASDKDLLVVCMYYQKKLLPGAYAIPSYRTQLEYACKEWIAEGWRSSKKVIDQLGWP